MCNNDRRNWRSKGRLIAALSCVFGLLAAGCSRHDDSVEAPKQGRDNSPQIEQDAANEAPSQPTEVPVETTAAVKLAITQRRQAEREALLDPKVDGWESEAFAEVAKKRLLSLLGSGQLNVADSDAIGTVLDEAVPIAYQQPSLIVRRQGAKPAVDAKLVDAVASLHEPFESIGTPRIHIKIVRVALPANERATTTALFESYAANPSGAIQQTATLECEWRRDPDDFDHPRVSRLHIADFEQVETQAKDGRWFADLTGQLLAGESSFQQQLALGLNHWSQRIGRVHNMDDTVRNGLAVGDANSDGLDDVYVCQGPGLPNRLFLQTDDGGVREVAAASGVDWMDQTSSALFLDLDNDGDQDLAIATAGGLLVMDNDGKGQFVLKAQLGSLSCDPQSLTGADFDGDGDVDLFLCVYRPDQAGSRGDFVFHDAITGGPNRLFRNDIGNARNATASANVAVDNWPFADVTTESGLNVGATRYSLASAWEDIDSDGDQDLYVANDYGRNYLYRNDGGVFTDDTGRLGLADTGFGMSASWGDIDRDGRLDLYIGNMFSSAGSRITRQQAFQSNATDTQRALYQRMAKGNSLFRNTTEGFVDISNDARVEMGRWAWSSVFADVNNDGWEDLLVGNGYITTDDTGDL